MIAVFGIDFDMILVNDNAGSELPGDVLSFCDEITASQWMEIEDVKRGNYVAVFDDGSLARIFLQDGKICIQKSSDIGSRSDLLKSYKLALDKQIG